MPALIYAVLAAIWILASDQVVLWLFRDPLQVALANTLKGWLFVAATALVFYLLLRRRDCLAEESPQMPASARAYSWPVLAIVVVILGVTAAGIINTLAHQRQQEEARLHAIADLKASQISDWLKERLGDAKFVQSSHFFSEQYESWQGQGNEAARERLTSRLEQLRNYRGFSAVSLLDPAGRRLWATQQAPARPAPALSHAVEQGWDGQIQRVGPYVDLEGHRRLDFLVPLPVSEGPSPMVVLHVDPEAWLFPMLQAWPVLSASGETLLFRQDGDRAQFLNDLRYRPDSAATFHLPLGNADLLAAQVLSGRVEEKATLEGVDYRGVPVLGMARAIPGTDWYLVAKVNRDEIHAAALRDVVWMGLTGALALFIILASLAMLRQRQRLAVAEQARQAEVERTRALKLLEAFAESSDDAIFAKDMKGRYILFNRAAGLFVGKPVEAVLGRDDRALFPPEQAELIMARDRRVIEEDRTLIVEEVLATASGSRLLLATKGPLRDERGQVIGSFGISRDITESRRSEDQLADQMRRFRLLLDSSRDGIVILDQEYRVVEANQRFVEMLGYAQEELVQLHAWDFDALMNRADIRSGFADLEHDRRLFETRHRRRDGSEYDVEISASGAVWGGQKLVLCICRDITQRKRAEAAVHESEARWIMAIDNAGHGVWDWNMDTGKVYYSPTWKAMLGYAEGEIGDSLEEWLDRVQPEDRGRCQAELERHYRGQTATYICEHRVRCKDGGYKWILDQGRVVTRDATGKPLRMIGTHTDISPVKAAQDALRRQSEELAQRNTELERFNRATVGRELDMIELKRQVNEMARELGREPPHDLSFAAAPGRNPVP